MSSHLPKKRFGQNFLQDNAIIHDIVRAIRPSQNDLMVEIGPGLGALTIPLMQYIQPLHVVEIDRELVKKLQAKFSNEVLIIHEADVLQFDFATLTPNSNESSQRLRIVGNLPYNISTPLLFYLLSFHSLIFDMHFMLQKEVVDRLVAQPKTADYGRLSVMLQYYFSMDKILDVPPEAFYPAPKVDSAIIRIYPYKTLPYQAKDERLFAKLVKEAFSQRRKTLRNNLRKEVSDAQFMEANIDPTRRPETLQIEEFVRLANILAQNLS